MPLSFLSFGAQLVERYEICWKGRAFLINAGGLFAASAIATLASVELGSCHVAKQGTGPWPAASAVPTGATIRGFARARCRRQRDSRPPAGDDHLE